MMSGVVLAEDQVHKTQNTCRSHRPQSLVHYSGSFFTEKSLFQMKTRTPLHNMAETGKETHAFCNMKLLL